MVGILGAGISGLTCAYKLQKANVPFVLLEASDRTGGWINSTRTEDNYLLEFGPNSLLIDQEIEGFLKEIGLTNQIIEASPNSENRFILKNGKIKQVPAKPPTLLSSSFLSMSSKLSIIKEYFRRPNNQIDHSETVYDFFSRHFSEEICDYLIDPFVTGVYAGTPKNLTIQEIFPKLHEYEQKYGSVLKGLQKEKRLQRRKTVSFKNGLQTITDTLTKLIPTDQVLLNHQIKSISKREKKFHVICQNDATFIFDKIINCCSPIESAIFLKTVDPILSKSIARIECPPLVLSHLVYEKKAIKSKINGFGLLFPKVEQKTLSGIIFNSEIFEHRCASDQLLMTCIIGGKGREHYLKEDDNIICVRVKNELKELLTVEKKPLYEHFKRHNHTIPQYNHTITDVKEKVKEYEKLGLFHATNWSNGVSLPDCIKQANKVSKKIVDLAVF